MSAGEGDRTRIVLVSERRLVGQAIAAALRTRVLMPVLFDWPHPPESRRSFTHRVVRSGAQIGVILCDLETPDVLHDVELLVGRVRIRWLVLTDSPPGPRWGTVLEAGAMGVLPTSTGTEGLSMAVRDLIAGRPPTPPDRRARLIQEWHDIAEEQRALVRRMELLTPREFQVLGLLYDGISVRRIAEASGVSESTVRTQVKALRRKLGVDSQLAAVATYRKALEVFPRRRVDGDTTVRS